jgi:hypothetical protein
MRLLVALPLLLSLFVSPLINRAEAATIAIFGQSTGTNLLTGDETAGITTLDANGVPVIITTLNETGVAINALFSLDAVSTGAVVNVFGSVYTQAYSGSFSILSAGGFNYLSGTFDGISLGADGGTTLLLGATQPPLTLVFTSDVVGMPLGDPTAMALAFTNILPGITIVNNSFGDFTSNVSGTFSAAPVIPEPATLLLLGTGLIGVSRRFLKSKKVSKQ